MRRKYALGKTGKRPQYDCIYCLRRLDGKDFNREHVLSDAFGAFRKALVLHYCVCRECNQFFADQLEVQFARGAFEGMLRYRTGLKTPPEGALHLRCVELAIPEGNEEWSGVRLKLMNEGGGLRVSLIAQAAFFDQRQERWVHVTEDEIDGGFLTRRPELKKGEIRIFARSAEEDRSVISRLREHGVNFQNERRLEPPKGLLEAAEMEVEVTLRVNQGIRRCVAKYAFNYLASVCGREFVLGADFDVVRQFIRYGNVPPYPLVVAGSEPILFDDRPTIRQTNGHLLTLGWGKSLGDLVGEVSIFNSVTYRVSLCRDFSGNVWIPIRSGVHYDIGRKIVMPLIGFPKDLVPA